MIPVERPLSLTKTGFFQSRQLGGRVWFLCASIALVKKSWRPRTSDCPGLEKRIVFPQSAFFQSDSIRMNWWIHWKRLGFFHDFQQSSFTVPSSSFPQRRLHKVSDTASAPGFGETVTMSQMDVSENRGTPKSSIFNRVFHYKPSILEVFPLFLETPKYLGWEPLLDLSGVLVGISSWERTHFLLRPIGSFGLHLASWTQHPPSSTGKSSETPAVSPKRATDIGIAAARTLKNTDKCLVESYSMTLNINIEVIEVC